MSEGSIEDVLAGRATHAVVCGDSCDVLRALPASSVNAVVTDPPAGIGFMGVEFDHHRGGRAQWVAWLADILGLARAACVPGSRAVVWALPRTSHWTGCAVEDAGWSIETKGVHLQGQGWPKGKSQLKPAAEDWWFARTGPSTVLNIDECRVRVGADDFAAMTGRSGKSTPSAVYGGGVGWHGEGTWSPSSTGRYPPNTLLSHLPACRLTGTRRVATGTAVNRNRDPNARNSWLGTRAPQTEDAGHADADGAESVDAWECAEGCAVAMLDAQSGVSVSPAKVTRGAGGQHGAYGAIGAQRDVVGHDDVGTASRFFPQFRASLGVPFLYCAKPSRGEKNEGCEELPQSDAASVAAFASNKVKRCSACERTHPVAHVGTCLRCGCGDLALDDAADDGRGRDGCRVRANTHPTVKSVALMRWLVRLITKPGDVVLDPFGGSGTTGVAALREGRRVILVEREPDFAAICRARLEHAAPSRERLARAVVEPVKVAPAALDFGPLFSGGAK